MTFIEYHVAKNRDVSSFPIEIWIFPRICERTSTFYERQRRVATLISTLRPELLTQPSSAILTDETASETVECSKLQAGVSCSPVSRIPALTPSISVRLPLRLLSRSFNFTAPYRSLARTRWSLATSISHSNSLSRLRRALFFATPPSPFRSGSLSFW